MRMLSLGAGATGGYFGGRMVEAGGDVTFLVRPARKAILAERGLVIESPCGNFQGPVHAVTADELGREAPFDIILLTCKAYDLDDAIAAIAPAVSERTAVLPLLNGMSHMDVLNKKFGQKRVLGGLAKIAATVAPDGTIKHLNDIRAITYGEQSGEMTPRLAEFGAAFGNTAAVLEPVPDIQQAMWEKLVFLATIAAMACLMRAGIGLIVRVGGGPMILEMLALNSEIAAKEGFAPSAAFSKQYQQQLTDPNIPYGASMLRDIERGGPIESDHIIGFMLNKARAHGLDARLLEITYLHLKAYEERRATGRL